MPPECGVVYRVEFDAKLFDAFEAINGPFLDNVGTLGALSRFRLRATEGEPLAKTSFYTALTMLIRAMKACGQGHMARSLKGLCHLLENKLQWFIRKGKATINNCDDFVRKHLKALSSWAFGYVYERGPAYMLLMHLHTTGGPSPWTKDSVAKDISSWLDGESAGKLDLLKPYIDETFIEWTVKSKARSKMSFSEFSSDPLRWGTPGGAKKSLIGGEVYRSKWAWIFSKILSKENTKDGVKSTLEYDPDVDLYEHALLEDPDCVVALKEEAAKTRQIITTPMASYIRQSYLMYLWGRLPDWSPLSSSRWVTKFQATSYKWYGCADAERFDHSVGIDTVEYILRKLGSYNHESSRVAEEEIRSIKDLWVTWGRKKWRYRGGLLSGWRITSIVGTLVSIAIGKYISAQVDMHGVDVAGSGDDIILSTNGKGLTNTELCELYNKTGYRANLAKTTAGSVGEFLRMIYSPVGIFGYPGTILGSLVYASPWLERFELTSEQALSSNWLTFYSRLVPHSRSHRSLTTWVRKCIKVEMRKMLDLDGGVIDDWLDTPICAGGGGPLEWSRFERWTKLFPAKREGKQKTRSLLSMFNIQSEKEREEDRVYKRKRTVVRVPLRPIREGARVMASLHPDGNDDAIPDDVNKTKTMFTWLYDDTLSTSWLEKRLRVFIPRSKRTNSKLDIFSYLMGTNEQAASLTSIQTTNEATAFYTDTVKALVKAASKSKRYYTMRDLDATATMFMMDHFSNVKFVVGTW